MKRFALIGLFTLACLPRIEKTDNTNETTSESNTNDNGSSNDNNGSSNDNNGSNGGSGNDNNGSNDNNGGGDTDNSNGGGDTDNSNGGGDTDNQDNSGSAVTCNGEPSSCSDIGNSVEAYSGCCWNDIVFYCEEEGTLSSIDCAAEGNTCSYSAEYEFHDCIQ